MATFHPYLFFGGNCAAAFTRYGEIFGGESFMMRMGDAPDQTGVPDDKKDSIIHAALTFEDGALLMGSDDPMTQSFGPVQGMQVSYSAPDVEDAGRVFDALARGGNPVQPLIETFFSPAFGMVVDEFGTPWMIVAENTRGSGLIPSSPIYDADLVVRFSDDDGFDFAIRCLLTGAPYGLADPGEVFAATAGVAPGDPDGWFDALTDLGARLEADAAARAARGHDVSAAGASLRAANYRYAGFWYVLATRDPGRWADAWHAHRRCLDAALHRRPDVTRLDTALADVVVFRAPDATAARPAPVLVVQGGLGAPLSDALMTGVDDARARGWHAVAFDGPGQGARRVRHGQGPVRDWGVVITEVLDGAVRELGDTADATRIALIGIADGAALALQGAAHDARVATLVCDPGVLRPVDAALGQLPAVVVDAWHRGNDDAVAAACSAATASDPQIAFTVAKLTEQWPGCSLRDVLHELTAWDVTPHLDRLRIPVLVCDPDAATSFPGQSAELARALGDRATLAPFSTAEGAGLDCEIGAPVVRATRIADWLDEAVGHERST